MSQSLVFIIVNEDALATLFCNWLKENHFDSQIFNEISDLSGMQFHRPSAILVDLKLINNKNKTILNTFQNEGVPIILLAHYSNYDIVKNNNYYEICPLPVEQERFNLLIGNAINYFNLYQENKNFRNEINQDIDYSTFLTRDDRVSELIQSLKNDNLENIIIIIGEKSVGKTALLNYIKMNRDLKNYQLKKFEFINEADLKKNLIEMSNSNLYNNKLIVEITSPFPDWQGWDESIKKIEKLKDANVYIVPPLRSRPLDIKFFISHYLNEINKYSIKNIEEITAKAERLLIEHDWPGNITEFHDTLKKSVRFTTQKLIDESDILLVLNMPDMSKSKDDILITDIISMDEFKKKIINYAYKKCGQNIYEASTKLKIGRATFYRLLHKYDII